MKNKYVYITDSAWFDQTALANPICPMDNHLESFYPEFFEVTYDTRVLATKEPSFFEKSMPFYNDYREVFGKAELFSSAWNHPAKNVFLDGVNQQQFEYIAERIKDSVEILYLFKCNTIKDLSLLEDCSNLKCVHIFWNTGLTALWNMKKNTSLKVLSFIGVRKLQFVETLINSEVEYINFDSSDHFGNKKEMLFDNGVFEDMPQLKYLFLIYKHSDNE